MLPGHTLIQLVVNVHNKCILLFEARVHIGIQIEQYGWHTLPCTHTHTHTVVDILSKHHMICS